jgi:ketosteroid isomerase-like protein
MAVTTGRYTVTIPGAGGDAGRYITVWRKDAGGAWKVLMDSGVPDPVAPGGGGAPDPEGRPG